MTDKELKKMSRLELLELLLEESKENEDLNTRVESLLQEKQEAEKLQMLQQLTGQLEASLEQFEGIAEQFKKIAQEGITVKEHHYNEKPVASPVVSVQYRSDEEKAAETDSESKADCENCTDLKIFRKLMLFYSQRPEAISTLPLPLQNDVVGRIRQAISEQRA